MSQKPSASRMAMVMSRTLGIIGNLQENWCCFFRDSPSSLGAGRQPDSNEGPPAARLGCREGRSMGTDVARVGRRAQGEGRNGVRRLGRYCPVPDRDRFAPDWGVRVHLNAWSSRKYVTVMPRGLMGINSLGRLVLN